ncbi:MAG TPA: NAD-dependent epimerase/dehydratase family protein [Sphingomonadales bacterium]|nr:NAD-dependent epimerase/dehydratase family protein [Sphingomonadales bacterium]
MAGVRKALVTGGAGFIGRHLVAHLLASNVSVRVLDPLAGKRPIPDGAEIVAGSVFDADALDAACEGVDCVFHLAALAHLWARDKRDYQRVNVEGTAAVIAAVKRHKVRRLVATSTETILRAWDDATAFPISESDPRPALSGMAGPYTRSKWQADELVQAAVKEGLDVVSLYPTVPVGPGDYGLTAPTQMILDFVKGKNPAYLNAGLNFVAVEDAAKAYLLAAGLAPTGGRYLIGGENLAMKTFLALLEKASGRKMPARAIPYDFALATAVVAEALADFVTRQPPAATREGVRLVRHPSFVSIEKAKRELAFSPTPVADALARALAWFKKEKLI